MRKPYFDNLKFILISCVVLVHFTECFRTEAVSFRGTYLFLCFFTMPAFALVSGYFSKTFSPRLKDFALLLAPYVVFQALCIPYYQWLALDKAYWSGGWSLTVPFIQNWYLLSLFAWRWISLCAKKVKHALALSFILALVAGFEHRISWDFALSRTICFLPFFLLGMHLDEPWLERLNRFRFLGVAVLLGLAAFSMLLSWIAPSKADVLIWNIIFATPYGSPSEVMYRIISYGFLLVATFGILAVIPRCETWFTRRGTRTMSVYLLHIFFALGFEKLHAVYKPIMSELLLIGCSMAVTMILSMQSVYKGFMFPFQRLGGWLEHKPKTSH